MANPLYLLEQGSRLGREGKRLIVSLNDETLATVPVIQVSQVIIFGNVQITTPALQLLLNEGIETVLLSVHGAFYGRVVGAAGGHGALRVAQIERSRAQIFAMQTAQAFVYGKVHNLKVFLQRYARRSGAVEVRAAADSVDLMLRRVKRTTTLNSLMGVEGQAAAVYFGVFKALLKPPWGFTGRVRRPPTDPVNVLLSFGYTLLVQNLLGAVLTVGLEPYVGFLHQVGYNKPSMALDLAEEFRPIVVDSVVLRCLNNEIVTPDHFEEGDADHPIVLKPEGRKLFLRELETRLTQEFKHPESGETVNYRRLFLLQAYRLAACVKADINSEAANYRPFLVR